AGVVAGPLGPEVLTRFQTYKGIGFIAATGALLYSLLRLAWRARDRSELRYRMLLDEASDGIFLADATGSYLDVNAKGCAMLGYDRMALLELQEADLIEEDEDAAGLAARRRELAAGRTVLRAVRVRSRDGTMIPVEISSRLREDGRVQSIMRDVSDRRLLEEQLRQAQKMEAVGQLTGGIAHDLNNVLATVVANADLVRHAIPDDGAVRADLEEIRRAAHRGADMIRKLLGFSRQTALHLEPLDLAAVVDEVLATLRRLLPSNITIDRRGDAANVPVRADRVALEQILINLATNARDAMPDGGTFTVTVTG